MLTSKQREMLIDFARDNEATDFAEYDRAGTLAWRNRERVIDALHKKGYLNEDGITEAGRRAVGIPKPAKKDDIEQRLDFASRLCGL